MDFDQIRPMQYVEPRFRIVVYGGSLTAFVTLALFFSNFPNVHLSFIVVYRILG